ncbi:MAG: 50S ribosomal protein L25 [Candidatus Muiribacterium halophilum]|uniref:Large ribosomal subunit protein bL25 n=1 Tax=Muiribacterium halophilum TaxID=2053465 RepID=A0A2N5ZKQ7_MUIH1|nr:MAG: 50S ribosomal protein L25 [Candidatus Muirbacterium halophilum]
MKLECKKREGTGKEFNRRLRKEKEVPGIIYGKKSEPLNIMFKENEFVKFLRANHGKPVYDINVENEDKKVVIKEIQERPWKNEYIHVDFQEIHKGETIHLVIPIHFHGAEEVEKKGGILNKNIQELDVVCQVEDIPEGFHVDVSQLEIHDSIHLRDMDIPENIKVSEEEERTICSVTVPRALVEPTETGEEGEGVEGEEGEESTSEETTEE